MDLLCACELGEHEIGIQGRKNLGCNTQNDLLVLIVDLANAELQFDGSKTVVRVELLSGAYPTYAALKRHESKLVVDEILFHCGLDTRPISLPARTMMTLHCRCMDEPIIITNCRCPASATRPWYLNVRRAVLPQYVQACWLKAFQ